jgi:hypothetical protein
MGMNKLFDKLIELKFYDKSGQMQDHIKIPDTGIKPSIGIQGNFITSSIVGNMSIRIVNFYPSVSLDQYAKIEVIAGYKDSQDTATISGRIMVGYQESPSPDGVTFFSFLPCDLDAFLNTVVQIDKPKQATKSSICQDLVDAMGWALDFSVNDGQIVSGFNMNATVKDIMIEFKSRYKLMYDLDGTILHIYDATNGKNGPVTNINYVTSPPQASAAGITFVAPWMPGLRPAMAIHIDPKYYRQNYGGAQVQLSTTLIVQSIEFQFNTVTNQNSMTVLALNTAEK